MKQLVEAGSRDASIELILAVYANFRDDVSSMILAVYRQCIDI